LLENLKLRLMVENSKVFDLNYKSKLFKMQTNQLSFEKFEELFDVEDENFPHEPPFESGWKQSEVENENHSGNKAHQVSF
jgi:hypothetical protein